MFQDMLWSPNERYADPTSVYGGYTPYWPDPSTVDIVGLSFYHYGTQARLNNLPVPGEALDVMSEFDSVSRIRRLVQLLHSKLMCHFHACQLFGSAQSKSIVLSETGAAYVCGRMNVCASLEAVCGAKLLPDRRVMPTPASLHLATPQKREHPSVHACPCTFRDLQG